MNKEVTHPVVIEKDPDEERGIDIYYQDLRPDQSPPIKGDSFLEKLMSPVDCLELSYEDQESYPIPFRSIFFNNQEELTQALDHARGAVRLSREYKQPIDPKSGRLVRYPHEEAVRLKIIEGFEVV